MTILTKEGHGFSARASRRDRMEYRLVWSLCFVMALVAAIVERLVSQLSRSPDKQAARQETILAEAKSAAHAAAGYAYMS